MGCTKLRRVAGGVRSVHISILLLTCFFVPRLFPETLILKCTADGAAGGSAAAMKARETETPAVVIADFEMWNAAGWKVESATLFLHVARGAAPSSVEVALIPVAWTERNPPSLDLKKLEFAEAAVTLEPQGWITIAVDPKLAEQLTQQKRNSLGGLAVRFKSAGMAIHTRETGAFAPYFILSRAS